MSDAYLAAVSALLEDVFHNGRYADGRYLSWLYRENPDGKEVATDLFDGDACQAHYCVIPKPFQRTGSALPMSLSLNTAVSQQVRMKGLFTRLGEETYAKAAARGIAAVIGVANANSSHGFINRLGFRLVRQLPVTMGASIPAWGHYETFDPKSRSRPDLVRAFGALDFSPRANWSPQWSAGRLAWRLHSPVGRFLVHAAPEAVAVSTTERRHGVPIAVILKTFGAPDRRTVSAACRASGTPFYLYCGMALGGLRLPRRLLPAPLNFIYRQLLPTAPSKDAFTLGNFEFLDFDAY